MELEHPREEWVERMSKQYSPNDLKELLECASSYVQIEQSGASYGCLGRAHALQMLEMDVTKNEQKIAACRQAVQNLKQSAQLYQEEVDTSKSREIREMRTKELEYVNGIISILEKRLNKLESGEEEKQLSKLIAERNSRCFIATAAFGDAQVAEVILLRQYRDQYLLQSSFGSILVRFYSLYFAAYCKVYFEINCTAQTHNEDRD